MVPEHFVINKSGKVFLISLATAVKIIEPRYKMPKYCGVRRSSSVGAVPDDDSFNDNYAGLRAQKSEERSLEGYLTKVLLPGLESQSSQSHVQY